jgi:hypothetical protein
MPAHEVIFGKEISDEHERLGSECPLIKHERACDISIGVAKKPFRGWINRGHKVLGILTGTQSDGGCHTIAFCQESQGTLKFKRLLPRVFASCRVYEIRGLGFPWTQRYRCRTANRTLSPIRAHFQNAINRNPCLRKIKSEAKPYPRNRQ